MAHSKFSGYNDNPIARRVRCIPTDYFLLTNRFRCKSGCRRTWQGTDPHILAQLPRFVSAAFPGGCLCYYTSNNSLQFFSIYQCTWCN
jgi:hypothetical protein